MFLHLSVSHSVHRGGSASVHAGIAEPLRSGYPPGADPPGADPCHLCGACWEIRPNSGRYASYWNAYLLLLKFCLIPRVTESSSSFSLKITTSGPIHVR